MTHLPDVTQGEEAAALVLQRTRALSLSSHPALLASLSGVSRPGEEAAGGPALFPLMAALLLHVLEVDRRAALANPEGDSPR